MESVRENGRDEQQYFTLACQPTPSSRPEKT